MSKMFWDFFFYFHQKTNILCSKGIAKVFCIARKKLQYTLHGQKKCYNTNTQYYLQYTINTINN